MLAEVLFGSKQLKYTSKIAVMKSFAICSLSRFTTFFSSARFAVASILSFLLPLRMVGLVLVVVLSIQEGMGQTFFSLTYILSGDGNNVYSFAYNGSAFDGVAPGALVKAGITSSSSNNNFRGSNWPLGATDVSDDFTGSVDLSKFIGFSIEPVPGFSFTITSIEFGIGRSGTGPRQWQWLGNGDSFGNPLENYSILNADLTNVEGVLTNPDSNSSWTGNVLNLAGNYGDMTEVAEFRLYGFNAEATGGTGGLQGNITINGFYRPLGDVGNKFVVDFDDPSKWIAGSGGIASFQTDHVYKDQNWLFSGGPALRQTTTAQDGYPGAFGLHAWRLSDDAGTLWTATYNSCGTLLQFGFSVRRWDGSPEPIWEVEYSLNGGAGYITLDEVINNDFLETSNWSFYSYSFESPLSVTSGQLVVRVKRIGGERVMIDNFTFTREVCEDTDWYFRTTASSEWNDACMWEKSIDGTTNWMPSDCPPGDEASIIVIKDGHHISLDTDLSAKTIHIQPNASLEVTSGIMTLGSNGGGVVILESGALLDLNGGKLPVINTGATVLVKSNATLRVSFNRAGFSDGLAGINSSGKIIYQTGSVFEWNVNSAFATSNQVYFPDADDETIPIFRVNGSPTVSADSPTTINGIFEANGNVSWQNSGVKTFRNGITGTGTITQAESSGAFIISGVTAQLGGSGNLVLASAGLEISSPNAILTSNKTIEGGEVKISGTLDMNLNNLILGGDLKISGSLAMDFNTLTLGGDLMVEESGNLISEGGTLVFNGAALQHLQIPEALTMSGFTLDNAAGLTINDHLTVNNTLNLVNGVVNMPGHILTLGNSLQTGTMTRTSGYIDGTYQVWLDDSRDFGITLPLGYGNDYAPVDLTFDVLSPGTLTGRFDKNLPDNYYGNLPITDIDTDGDGDDVVVNNLSSEGYWHILSENGLTTGPYSITLGFPPGMSDPIVYPDLLRVVKRENADDDWAIAGRFESATELSITHSGVDGFSEFALGGNYADNPLPIELLHFTATEKEDKVILTWATASETNNDFFTLERSNDANHVETIGYVAGVGNSVQTRDYSYTDASPLEGISYYRLKQTDFDGAYDYSQWIAFERGLDSSSLRIVSILKQNDHVYFWAEAPTGQSLRIEVYDLYGRILYQTRVIPDTHLFQHSFSTVTNGMAIIRLSSKKETAVKKLVLR